MDTQSQAFMNQRDLSGLFAQWAAADTPPSKSDKEKAIDFEIHEGDDDDTREAKFRAKQKYDSDHPEERLVNQPNVIPF